MASEKGVRVFEVFPEFKALGAAKLQSLCDKWRVTPLAREFAVASLTVDVIDGSFLLSFVLELNHNFSGGDEYHFPMDELLFYVADNGVADRGQRESLKKRIKTVRRAAPDVYRRFILQPGPKLPLFVTCKNCGNLMQTNMEAYRVEQIRFEPESIVCPRCKQSFVSDGSDFHFGPNEQK
ncbi:MAG: hypothetical protein ACO1RA_21170 [Planctomycetaceae bacterium]